MNNISNNNSKVILRQNYKKWRNKKKQQGWIQISALVPKELGEKIKTLMRDFKYNNPQYYEKTY